jgi:DNA-binding NtrC family response regulator
MIYRALIEIKKDLIDLKSLAAKTQSENSSGNLSNSPNEVVPLVKIEKQAIINALNYTKHNKRRSAQLLGISERTLYRKIQEYGIE